ncbi:MAG: hypothetical protein JRN62_03340 [Nitrososphaerota archaeon]|nr:hypothetical protein [Nitrososphaerota archaeon]MDG6948632.1 hypothetical protein [Nitrososphaerota archaeon]
MSRKTPGAILVANSTGIPLYVSVCDYGDEINVHIASKDVDSNHADPTEVPTTRNAVFSSVAVKREVKVSTHGK